MDIPKPKPPVNPLPPIPHKRYEVKPPRKQKPEDDLQNRIDKLESSLNRNKNDRR